MSRTRSSQTMDLLTEAAASYLLVDGFVHLGLVSDTLIHFQRWLFGGRTAYDNGRNAGDGRMWRNVAQHDTSRSDLRTIANFDVTENLRAGADQHSPAHLGMTIPCGFSRPPQLYFMQQRNIVVINRSLSDHDTGCVVDENAFADPCRGMDVDRKHFRDSILHIAGQRFALLYPEPVSDTVGLQRVEALVVKKRLRNTA